MYIRTLEPLKTRKETEELKFKSPRVNELLKS